LSIICNGCLQLIVPLKEPRYTGREPEEHWHYKCWEIGRPEPTNVQTLAAQLATSTLKVERAFGELKRRLKSVG
jgi:hypothetical protein